ncbi:methyltransferase domain-containing protein [Nocardia stercoris]|uniref:Methyltransferase domain-containing protein n=1 Tax=Nocardia stercoris TaxID=2483361 RepID=A0A3M2KZ39_9NOCA|nr:methyltransferase domain-containing protein [Nocardia stercoris]
MLIRLPGVYRPQTDSQLLAEALSATVVHQHTRVLDLFTGTGYLALAAGRAGAGSVTAVDISRRAAVTARCNAYLHRMRIDIRCGDFATSELGQFDLVLANPPYVPGPRAGTVPGSARAWDAGPDGRDLLDPLCDLLPTLLAPGGVALLVHSTLCGTDHTLRRLGTGPLDCAVVAERRVPFGPVLRSRRAWLTSRGLIAAADTGEDLVVIRATRAAAPVPVTELQCG